MSGVLEEESEKVLAAPQTRKQCTQCEAVLAFTKTLYSTDLPVRIVCPFCHWTYELRTAEDRVYLQFPKIDMLKITKGPWYVEKIEKIEQVQEPDSLVSTGKSEATPGELIDQLAKFSQQDRDLSFRQRADELSALVLASFHVSESLIRDLKRFEETFREDMHLRYEQTHSFRKGWSPAHLEDFLNHPFWVTHLDVTEAMAPQSRLFLCPQFYRRLFGVPLENTLLSGFYFQVVLPYFLMGRTLDGWCEQVLQIQPPRLRVRGTKIEGVDLEVFYAKIPGVVTDEDHTEWTPSIRMERSQHQHARMWLAEHGIAAWEKKETPENQLLSYPMRILPEEKGTDYALLQEEFLERGRIAFLCEDHDVQIARVKSLATCYRSIVLVVVPNLDARSTWRGTDIAEEDIWTQRFAFHAWNEFQSLQGWEEFSFVVVDLTESAYGTREPIPNSFLSFLYQYRGRLLLLLDDALLDALEENERARHVYGLVHSSFFYPSFQWKAEDWKGARKKQGTLLQEALLKLME